MPSILIAVVLLAVTVIAEAQQAKIPRIGYLTVTGPSPSQALLQGLRDLGYVVGSLFLLAVALSLRLYPCHCRGVCVEKADTSEWNSRAEGAEQGLTRACT